MHSPFGGWHHHLSAPLGSVSLDSQSPAAPCESSSLATPQFGEAAKGKRLNGQARCPVRLPRNILLTIDRGGKGVHRYLYPKDLHTGLPHEEGGEEHGASPQLLRGAEPSRHHRPCHLRDGAVGGSAAQAGGRQIQRREHFLRENQMRRMRRLLRSQGLA